MCLQGWHTHVQLARTQRAAVNATTHASVTSLFFLISDSVQNGPKQPQIGPIRAEMCFFIKKEKIYIALKPQFKNEI